MDLIINYNEAKKIVDDLGWNGFLNHFKELYPQMALYSCSQYWYEDDKYICKFRGLKGDLIIGWERVHAS